MKQEEKRIKVGEGEDKEIIKVEDEKKDEEKNEGEEKGER